MRIDIISAVPELLESPLNHSIIRRARDKGLVEIHIVNLHDYGKGNYKQIDDYGFGGDAGMVIKPEPLHHRESTTISSTRHRTERCWNKVCATVCPHVATL